MPMPDLQDSRLPRSYLSARPRRRPLIAAGLLCAAIVMTVALRATLDSPEILAPGALSLSHAFLDGQCAQCHTPEAGVSDRQCQVCHDQEADGHFTLAAHLTTGRAPGARVTNDSVTCATCHTEHLGRTPARQAVPNATCATCHLFGSIETHPDLPIDSGRLVEGLRFSHAVHMGEVSRLGSDCEACHTIDPATAAFEPRSFDQDCASCHVRDGQLRPIGGRPMPPVAHRDPTVLAELARLTGQLDPEGVGVARAALADARAELEQIRAARARGGPRPAASRAALAASQDRLDQTAWWLDRAAVAVGGADGDTASAVAASRDAVAGPCLECHAPPTISGFRVGRASARRSPSFQHGPHLALATCRTCHADVVTSATLSTLLPTRVATCRDCHASEPVLDVCAACHQFHPAPPTARRLRDLSLGPAR